VITDGDFLTPDWQVPANVEAWFTTRAGGLSKGPYTSMNLGLHVGDASDAVEENRRRALRGVAARPLWLSQVHGVAVAHADGIAPGTSAPVADAAVSFGTAWVCCVLVADCLPVYFADRMGTAVAVAHAGWRGLAAGVLENTVRAMRRPPVTLLAHLGPAIGPRSFEVGDDVRSAFMAGDAAFGSAFHPVDGRAGKWWCDLYALARQRLQAAGVEEISGGTHCTHCEAERFFSYRRDGVTGRMGAFIRLAR
jgi:YfiH family protein